MNASILFLSPDSDTWRAAWAALQRKHGCIECLCASSGEVWQYMGSVAQDDGVAVEHQFRHRSLNGKRAMFRFVSALNRDHYQG